MRLESLGGVLLSASCALIACQTSPSSPEEDAGTPPADAGVPDAGLLPDAGLARSSRNNLRFKGPERLSADFAAALALPEEQVCNELGRYPCTAQVHRVTLGGVDPYNNELYEPLPATGVTSPLAVDRVALAACTQRVTIDLTTPSSGVLFGHIPLDAQGRLVDRTGTPVKEALTALYQRVLLRDPTAAEVEAFFQLASDIETSSSVQPGRDWMKAACFAVLSSAESVFF
ncbi:hypothetical protein [Stigmatella aurantiaca]|uniref:Lipoprotein n=1 Tax=Stigmatella aurantiaca (strain DW4/3-1) TaxID=378806 RepID=Q09AE2_STIAD|nr:hypothetical protein [Stigmatella aurantiaca]ADO67988.1 uncharacterized protein STAUR_0179 [Stigmatella aurantiaca DW4/3-1]EAU68764.1 hypothetical protein STIAU_2826 [Stigmatella aurantiaca DW4/3-1]